MAFTKFKAPALPVPPIDYDQRYGTDLIRTLRLYFNIIDSLTPQEAESYTASNFYGGNFFGYGRGLSFPYISMQDLQDQLLTAALTPKRVTYNSTVANNQMFYVGNDGIHVDYGGIYNLQYSFQLVNTDNAQHYAWIWLRVNGVDLPGSATKFSVLPKKTALLHSYVCAVSNVVFPLNAGDYVEVWWAADAIYVPATSDGIYMEYYAANSDGFNHPSIPSAIATMTFLSALPNSTVISVAALGQIGTPTVTGGAKEYPTGIAGTGSTGSVSVTTGP